MYGIACTEWHTSIYTRRLRAFRCNDLRITRRDCGFYFLYGICMCVRVCWCFLSSKNTKQMMSGGDAAMPTDGHIISNHTYVYCCIFILYIIEWISTQFYIDSPLCVTANGKTDRSVYLSIHTDISIYMFIVVSVRTIHIYIYHWIDVHCRRRRCRRFSGKSSRTNAKTTEKKGILLAAAAVRWYFLPSSISSTCTHSFIAHCSLFSIRWYHSFVRAWSEYLLNRRLSVVVRVWVRFFSETAKFCCILEYFRFSAWPRFAFVVTIIILLSSIQCPSWKTIDLFFFKWMERCEICDSNRLPSRRTLPKQRTKNMRNNMLKVIRLCQNVQRWLKYASHPHIDRWCIVKRERQAAHHTKQPNITQTKVTIHSMQFDRNIENS